MLDAPTRGLIRLASAIAAGNERLLAERVAEAGANGVPPIWVDELLLQSVLMAGYPRALAAAGVWRQREATVASLEDGADFALIPTWAARGEEVCHLIYASNYEKLRSNVQRLHPALDAWMIREGYGRTLGRPGLDLIRRELCVIAQVAVLGADRQLHSHLRGALNAGARVDLIEETLAIVLPDCGPDEAERARALWQRVSG